MAIRFQRHLGGVESLDCQQYTVETMSGRPAIRCSCCGGVDDLSVTHEIDPEGRVTPAWRCGTETCSFFDWIYLESFEENSRYSDGDK